MAGENEIFAHADSRSSRVITTASQHPRQVICADAIGNGLSTSPSNSQTQPDLSFPRFNVRDMVASQRKSLDSLGVGRLASIVGASMGGMQALQWGVSQPDRMRSVVALVPMARTRP